MDVVIGTSLMSPDRDWLHKPWQNCVGHIDFAEMHADQRALCFGQSLKVILMLDLAEMHADQKEFCALVSC